MPIVERSTKLPAHEAIQVYFWFFFCRYGATKREKRTFVISNYGTKGLLVRCENKILHFWLVMYKVSLTVAEYINRDMCIAIAN